MVLSQHPQASADMLLVHLLAVTSACDGVQDLLVLPGPLPHLVLVIPSIWLPPSSHPAPHFWFLGYPGFLQSCIPVRCSWLVAVLHAESSWTLTFPFLPGSRPVSLQPNPHPKSSLLPGIPMVSSLSPVGSFPHLPVCALLTLPGPGQGVRGGRSCLISERDWTCALDFSDPQLCLSGNPA